jgi:hypothetical protein
MKRCLVVCCLLGLALTGQVGAEVRSLEILERKDFAGGRSFGDVGPYEILRGVVKFEVDPNHARNKIIVDLDKAPRNSAGKVEFESDFYILSPKDPQKGNGAIFYDVNNRGNKLALRFFNDTNGSNLPVDLKDAGNGFLFRRGYTIVWCGWIGELLPGNDLLVMNAPVATEKGESIRGIVKYEMVANEPVKSLPLPVRPAHGSYPPTKKGEETGVLTWRVRPFDARVVIPNSQWWLERLPVEPPQKGVTVPHGQVKLHIAGGFRPGYIYELVCEAEGPVVQGLGLAATRDLISFLRYETGKSNPLATGKPVLQYAYGFGVSQSGRFLRHFLHEGFNADEKDRIVFDGLIPHVAGGGLGFFNHRFAQPTRHNGQHENHFYPADVFPFTYGMETDPFSKEEDGILNRLGKEKSAFVPKIMHTQSAAEYWHRAGSLVHTDPLGKKDADIPDNVRIYAFGGTQHGPAGWPPSPGIGDNLPNPGDYRPLLRALLDSLDTWVREGKEPPASKYPTIAEGTLVHWSQKSTGFPALPGVRFPEVIQQPHKCDFGPRFATEKIITQEPPKVIGVYKVLVPKSDKDGNDLGTLLIPDVAVPLATYTGWNLRNRTVGAEAMLASLQGSYIPFAKTKAERLKSGDPRLSLQERYGNLGAYQKQYLKVCADMVRQGYLLREDADRLIEERKKVAEYFR